MPLTKLNSLAIPPDTIVESDLSYPLTNFSSTGIDDNATGTAITIDSSNAVGINTVSASGPQSTFHIEQNGDDADGGFRLSRDNALASYTQYLNTSSIWNLAYGNPSSDDSPTDLLSVKTNGNVGIGDDDPVARLQVSAGSTANAPTIGSISANAPFYLTNSDHAYGLVIGTDAGDGHTWLQGQRTDGTATAYNITLNEAGGKVGIRTDTPDSELDVRGIVLAGAGSPSTGQIAFGVQYGGSTNIPNTFGTMKSSAATCIGWGVYGNPSVTEGFVSSVDTSLNFRRGALLVDQDELRFLNAGQQTVARDAAVTMTERIKVDASGRLMLNIAASSIQAPLRAQAFGNTSSYFGYYFDTSGTVLSYVRGDGLFSTGTGSLSPYSFSTSGRDVYVNSSGQLGYVSSIREAKENIQPIEDVSWLYSLSPVSFNYKEKDDEGRFTREVNEEVEYGLIADEVEQVNANLCFYDENEEGDKALAGISYRKLIPVLTKAIQEQQAMIKTLQAEVTALKEAP